ncbi:hypothetical protein DYB34_013345 [Aphanomyces astaci]|uniref:Major facilitator superfamily (MFS) profile domain-containing protein n=1 Tax=Aphanomyces astaci TaxID=112090 RepID=A0A3R7DEM0_APHAT|nr:hypothetical protein DYB34_013345 [Aphanomyces astaci]
MDSADESNVLTIHEAIQRVGYGTFQKRLLLVSGLMFMAVMLLSFLQVLVKDEWHLTSTQQAGITAAVFAGELPGALFWGFFADKYGRRLGFLLSALIILLFPRIFKPEDGQTFNYTCIFLAAVAEVLGVFLTMTIVDTSMSVAGVCGIYGTCLLLTTAACYLLPPDSIDPDLLVVCDTACELVALTTEEDSSVGKASD